MRFPRDIIQVPPDQRGRKSGDMNFYGELLIIATVTWFGVISDKVGRRVVYTFGMLMMAAGLLLYPYAESYLMLVGFRSSPPVESFNNAQAIVLKQEYFGQELS